MEEGKGEAKEPEPGSSGMESQVLPRQMARGKTCRIMFASNGYTTWDEEIRKALRALNPEQTEKEIETEISDQGFHVSTRYLTGDTLVVIGQEPGDLSKISGRKAWLKWWYGSQQEVTKNWGKINQLISPSREYDKWLRFVARETGMEVSCRDPAARSVANHKEYKEVLGAEFAFETTPHKEYMKVWHDAALDELARTNRKVREENAALTRQNLEYKKEKDGGKKSKFKTDRDAVKEEEDSSGEKPPTPGCSTTEYRPKLKPIPNPTKIKKRPGGTTLTTWVGDPWAINGDVLLVVTDWDLNILNSKFRDQLKGRVGRGYQPELKAIKWGKHLLLGHNTPARQKDQARRGLVHLSKNDNQMPRSRDSKHGDPRFKTNGDMYRCHLAGRTRLEERGEDYSGRGETYVRKFYRRRALRDSAGDPPRARQREEG